MNAEDPILFYDGVCALCNGAVRFVLRRDRSRRVRFAPLQGETARAFLEAHPELRSIDSMIWLDREFIATRSEAAIAMGRFLGGFWGGVASATSVVPRAIRDGVYDFVARIRYRTFGKYDACPIPPLEDSSRFLT
jgi:predicted DCC family thiol-disulfide oxidoreductase YuxK